MSCVQCCNSLCYLPKHFACCRGQHYAEMVFLCMPGGSLSGQYDCNTAIIFTSGNIQSFNNCFCIPLSLIECQVHSSFAVNCFQAILFTNASRVFNLAAFDFEGAPPKGTETRFLCRRTSSSCSRAARARSACSWVNTCPSP